MDNVNLIIRGIARALHAETGYPVYTSFQQQNAKFPCFYIELIEASQEQELAERYARQHHFDIHFFQDENGEVSDAAALRELADALYMALEYITLDDGRKLRGTDMESRVTDNVLHFLVHYDVFVFKVRETVPYMETLTTEGRIKNG